jgi:imidazolonepropionase
MASPGVAAHLAFMTRTRWDSIWLGPNLATFDSNLPGPWGEIADGALAIDGDRIVWLGPVSELPGAPEALAERVRHAHGTWITPGLIDCHTHLVHGGDRIGEWVARLGGRDYDDIAREGGGIMQTVGQTRAASDEELLAGAVSRLTDLARDGVTTVEVKSGYDLTAAGEIRMLDVAHAAGRLAKVQVQGTLLGLHALPAEFEHHRADYVDLVAREMIPAARARGRARQVDAFVEGFAFSAEECERVFEAARVAELGLRVHADQRSDSGGAALAGRWCAASADHLERTSPAGVRAMAEGGCVAVLLPGAYLTLRDDHPPPVQAFRDAGVPFAVATDLNPGSSPVRSLRAAGSLACSLFGLHPSESLAGMTREAARVLGLADRGRLAVGLRADLAVWDVERPEELLYWIGGSPLRDRVVGGVVDERERA